MGFCPIPHHGAACNSINHVLLKKTTESEGDQIVTRTDMEVKPDVLTEGKPVSLAVAKQLHVVMPAKLPAGEKEDVV